MPARSIRKILCLFLFIALWAGVVQMPAYCAEQSMSCCMELAQDCSVSADCCHCGSAPDRGAIASVYFKQPEPQKVFPVSQKIREFTGAWTATLSANKLSAAVKTKPPARLYLLNRSLLI